MAKTLVGVFDDKESARSVVRELGTLGVQQSHIRLMDNSEATTDVKDDIPWTEKVANWFSSLVDDDNDRAYADHYAEAWRRGHHIVVADVETGMVDGAVAIMNRYGTVDVTRRAEQWKSTGYTGSFDRTAKPYTAEERGRELATYQRSQQTLQTQQNVTDKTAIPVVQEELAVGKRVVQRGGVRIHSYVEERPVEEVVRLREERISVQRRPVNRPADAGDLAFRERTVDVKAMAEEAVVEKRARVVEEVVVGKVVEQHDETIKETVRRKDVKVEAMPSATTPTTPGTMSTKTTTKSMPSTTTRPAPESRR